MLKNFCPKCGNISSDYLTFVCDCGTKMINTNISSVDFAKSEESMNKYTKQIQEEYIFVHSDFDREMFETREAQIARNIEENNKRDEYEKDHPSCPVCGSTALSANKKGFGLGKAAVGGLALGGIGLLGGFIGSRKVEITCLNCGHRFRPGDN